MMDPSYFEKKMDEIGREIRKYLFISDNQFVRPASAGLSWEANDIIKAALIEVYANAVRDEREACAKMADQWSEQSGGESVKQKQLSNRLGNDPFGHGEQADFASEDLKLVAEELSCFAQAIRNREEPSK